MDKELTKEQQQYKEQQMIIGSEYEVMIKSRGWEYSQTWYKTQLASFINSVLSDDTQPIQEYEPARQQLIGFKRFMQHVEGAIALLKDEQRKNTE